MKLQLVAATPTETAISPYSKSDAVTAPAVVSCASVILALATVLGIVPPRLSQFPPKFEVPGVNPRPPVTSLELNSLFLKSSSATETKALPFHLGNLPTVLPNKVATFKPNPPCSFGTVF